MQHLSKLEVMQRAVRAKICTQCYQRPPGSEFLPPDEARDCQPLCALFNNLTRLAGAVLGPHGKIEQPEALMRDYVCAHCASTPSAGDFCADNLNRTCPLSRYWPDVIKVLEEVAATSHGQ